MKRLLTAALALSLMTGTAAMAQPDHHDDHGYQAMTSTAPIARARSTSAMTRARLNTTGPAASACRPPTTRTAATTWTIAAITCAARRTATSGSRRTTTTPWSRSRPA